MAVEEFSLPAYTSIHGRIDGAANLYLRLRLVFKITADRCSPMTGPWHQRHEYSGVWSSSLADFRPTVTNTESSNDPSILVKQRPVPSFALAEFRTPAAASLALVVRGG